MNQRIFITSGVLLIALFLYTSDTLAHSVDGPQTHNVYINEEDGFSPAQLEIQHGDTVLFVNEGEDDHWPASDVHPTHEIYSDFDPQRPIGSGESWGFTFDQEGVWEMHDHLFPWLLGTITVIEDGEEVYLDNINKGGSFWGSIKSFFSSFWGRFKSTLSTDRPKKDKGQITVLAPRGGEETKEEKKEEREAEVSIINLIKNVQEIKKTTDIKKDLLGPNTDEAFSARSRTASDNSTALQIYENLDFNCEPTNFSCINKVIRNIVKEHGPEVGVGVLELFQYNGDMNTSVDDHQLSHQIGRETAQTFGVNSDAFVMCPMAAFNGGCQHGFFEYVLGQTETSSEAASLICESLTGVSSKDNFYCYHGVGHGVMMAAAYDLPRALSTCDALEPGSPQEGCWQGLFMENTNGAMIGEARAGVFSDRSAPLEPCISLDQKYRWQCYLNHPGWLMYLFGNDAGQAANACLGAQKDDQRACLQSIGLMTTNPVWQRNLTDTTGRSFVESAWDICLKFPKGRIDECVIGGVDNLTNFDQLETTRVKAFCGIVDENLKDLCYRTAGLNFSRNAITDDDIIDACGTLGIYEGVCLKGAGKQ